MENKDTKMALLHRMAMKILFWASCTGWLMGGTSLAAADDPVEAFRTALEDAQGDLEKLESSQSLNAPLTREQARAVIDLAVASFKRQRSEAMRERIEKKSLTVDSMELKWLERRFGDKPATGHSLFISMHGGGGAPKAVNDSQWKNQIRLYEPKEGIVVAPRAPGDTWDLWHQSHIDTLFDELIKTYAIAEGIDRNRVYLLGYSAGGDGVYQLAPRMADRFAAASMMAGHPNESQPLGLRNLPFAIFMGGNDSAYNRNEVAKTWGAQLDELRKEDPAGYVHDVHIFAGKGHWMDGEDRMALDWMQKQTRNTMPNKIVWYQDDVVHSSFYWLSTSSKELTAGQKVVAERDGNTIRVTCEKPKELTCWLDDESFDFDQPVQILWNGQTVFEGPILRTANSIVRSLNLHSDPSRIAVGSQTIKFDDSGKE
jgi:predicted esterase